MVPPWLIYFAHFLFSRTGFLFLYHFNYLIGLEVLLNVIHTRTETLKKYKLNFIKDWFEGKMKNEGLSVLVT